MFIARESAVPAGVSVVVVCHEIAGSASFAGWADSGYFVAFNFVHGVDAFFLFRAFFMLCSASFLSFLGFFFRRSFCLGWFLGHFTLSPLPSVSLAGCSVLSYNLIRCGLPEPLFRIRGQPQQSCKCLFWYPFS